MPEVFTCQFDRSVHAWLSLVVLTDVSIYFVEVEKMKKQLEEEIRAQLMANQEMLTQNTQSWEEQVKMS